MAVEKITSEEIEISAPEAEFSSVRIDEFFTGGVTLFDVYVKMGSTKFLRIFSAGDTFDDEKIKMYEEEKGIRFLHLAQKDRRKYVDFSRKLLGKVFNLKQIPTKTKFAVARNLYEKYMQEIRTGDLNDAILQQGKEICETIVTLIEAEPGIQDHLLAFDRFEATPYSHAFISGMFSVYVSKQFKWTSKQISEQLLMASLICDIGLREVAPEITKLKIGKMTKAQRLEYEKHPDYSHQILEESKVVSSSVKQIVLQHHEQCDSSGYPNRPPSDRIMVLAKVAALTDDFARWVQDYLLPPKEAVAVMFPDRSEAAFLEPTEQMQKYDKPTLVEFFKLFEGKAAKK